METREHSADKKEIVSQRRWTWPVSLFLAITLFVAASIFESETSFVLLYPGVLITWPFWPEGIHSHAGGMLSAAGFYALFVLGNVAIWTLAFRAAISLAVRRHR